MSKTAEQYKEEVEALTKESNKVSFEIEKLKAVVAVKKAELDKVKASLKAKGINDTKELDARIKALQAEIEEKLKTWREKIEEGKGIIATVTNELRKVEFQ